ncbi:MAG: phage tail protein [Chloroflexota bacterium]|nr:phage tail protein [Chloroflexota bacterium]
MTKTGQRAETHAAFRFAVQIEGIDEAFFSECTLPSLEVEITEQKEGGYNSGTHLLPGRVKAGRVSLKRGVAHSTELLNWYRDVINGNLSAAMRRVSVVMYDSKLDEVMRLNFEGAYPTKWTGPSFKASENSVAIETLELAFAEVTID